jgi:hypothetical protein
MGPEQGSGQALSGVFQQLVTPGEDPGFISNG